MKEAQNVIEKIEPAPLAQVPTTPEGMLTQALASGLAPEAMKEFYALYRQMKADQARATFFGAMAEFRAKCSLIAKSKTASILMKSGAKFSFDYAPIEEVAATINPELSPLGLSFGFDSVNDDKGITVTCIVTHRDGHEVRSSSWCPFDFESKMSPANLTTAAWTTARRKALMQSFGLVAADEKDAEAMGAGRGGGGKVTAHQADTLDTMLAEFPPERRAKFLAKIGYQALADIPADRYQEAVNMIEAARKAGSK